MHVRPPSFDHGVVSFAWAVGLALFILFGSIAIGVSAATALIVAGLAGAAIFFYVRLYGEDDLRS